MVSPLNMQVAMVTKEGTPTPEFMRWWQEFLVAVNPLAFEEGISDLLDLIGTTQGAILIRTATAWALLTPGTTGQALITQGTAADPIWDSVSGGAWIDLTDTPSSFSGDALRAVRVNAGETALEFYTPSAGVTTWLALTDTPGSFSGEAGQVVAVNVGEDGLEFVDPAGNTTYIDPVVVFDMGTSGTQSTSSYACKGDVFTMSENRIVTQVDFPEGSAGYDVKFMILEVDATNPHAIVAITYESAPQASATTNTFKLTTGKLLDSARSYAFVLVRDGDTDTSVVNLSFPGSGGPADPAGIWTGVSSVRAALESPAISDTLYFAAYSTTAVRMTIRSVDATLKNVLGGGGGAWLDLNDTPIAFTGESGQVVAVNVGEDGLEFIDPPAGVATWLALTDTPANFSGDALKAVRVNAGETALEFYVPTSSGTWLGLSDTPSAFTGEAGQVVAVNAGETALELIDPPSGGGGASFPMGFAKFTKPANTFTAINSGTPTENAYVAGHDTWRIVTSGVQGMAIAMQAGLASDGVVIMRTHIKYVDDTFSALGVMYGENSSGRRSAFALGFGNNVLKQLWNGFTFVSESTINPPGENSYSLGRLNYLYWKFERSGTAITMYYSRDGLYWLLLGSGTTTENSMSDVDEIGIFINTPSVSSTTLLVVEVYGLDTAQQDEAGT